MTLTAEQREQLKEIFKVADEILQYLKEEYPTVKIFTQEEVNNIMSQNKRSLQKELEDSRAQTNALQNKVDDLKIRLEDATTNPSGTPPADLEGKLEIMEKRHKREMEQLRGENTSLKDQFDGERVTRRQTERDKELGDALQDVRCIDPIAGSRYFLPQIELDDEEGKWMYRTKAGNIVTILDGVREEIPSYLKPAAIPGGGSGSSSGSPKSAAKARKIEAETKKMDQLQVGAKRSGRQADIVSYQRQKRIVEDLRQEK